MTIAYNTPYPVVVNTTTNVALILVGGNSGLSLSDLANNHTSVSEIPTRTSSTIFTLANIPLKVLVVTINGQEISLGSGVLKYTVLTNTIVFGTATDVTDDVRVTYLY